MLAFSTIRSFAVLFITLVFTASAFAQEDISPLISDPYAPNSTPEQVAAAKERGAAVAREDISRGILRLLGHGFPGPSAPEIDPETGYLVKHLYTCGASSAFLAELSAYNTVMREWQQKSKRESSAK